MHQVTFSEQSIMELNKLPPEEQMHLIETLSAVNPDELERRSLECGKFQRDGTTFYRLRPKDYRIYFEIKGQGIVFCHYILHPHTFSDFLFRFKLPITEDQLIEQNQSFWKYLETLK